MYIENVATHRLRNYGVGGRRPNLLPNTTIAEDMQYWRNPLFPIPHVIRGSNYLMYLT